MLAFFCEMPAYRACTVREYSRVRTNVQGRAYRSARLKHFLHIARRCWIDSIEDHNM